MSFPAKYLGSFRHVCDDSTPRDIHVWAGNGPWGELVCIYFGISTLLNCATGPMHVKDCATRLQRAALAFARREDNAVVELIENIKRSGEVIRLDEHR